MILIVSTILHGIQEAISFKTNLIYISLRKCCKLKNDTSPIVMVYVSFTDVNIWGEMHVLELTNIYL